MIFFRRFSLLVLISIALFPAKGQYTKYLIQFNNKGNNPYQISNPSAYLSARALERRQRYSIPIDSSDLPVTPSYIDSIVLSGNVRLLNASKWLNQIAIETSDDNALIKIHSFPFVARVSGLAAKEASCRNKFPENFSASDAPTYERPHGFFAYGRTAAQMRLHELEFLHDRGFRGNNMQMAIMDAGFLRYPTLRTFDSININRQILGAWDFVSNEDTVYEDYYHGMQCLSVIAANMPGVFVGTAPKTSFYLYRTEDINSEYPIEEQHWAVAAERADSAGVDVISSSLGYTTFSDPAFNYSYADLDGRTTISAKAAHLASLKGMLVVIATGNDGDKPWRYITTPADADNILAVGAVDTLGRVADFSSFGPSADGRIKPDVASVGWNAVVANPSNGLPVTGSGTSFACPAMAGLVTCLWQAFPEFSNTEVMDLLKMACDSFDNPNDRTGYGIPSAKKAFVKGLQKLFKRKETKGTDCQLSIKLNMKWDSSMTLIVERKSSRALAFSTIISQQGPDVFSISDFNFSDDLTDLDADSYFYRLQLKIGDDTTVLLDAFTYELLRSCAVNENAVTVIPNYPAPTRVSVKYATIFSGVADIIIYNTAGQMILHKKFSHPPGIRQYDFDLNRCSAGMYVIVSRLDGKIMVSRKFIRP